MYVDFTSINGFKGRHKTKVLINPKPQDQQKLVTPFAQNAYL